MIVEKSPKVGGYCSSFQSHGFRFDACAHSLSSLRTGGRLYRILDYIGVLQKLSIKKHTPSEIIITPDKNIKIYHNNPQTIDDFQRAFPCEKQELSNFFNFIISSPDSKIISLRKTTFTHFLDSSFTNYKLKTIFSTILFLITGTHPDILSAVIGCFLIREFIFDGGYYPTGGMQAFADILAKRYLELNGRLIIKKKAVRIITKANQVTEVLLEDRTKIGCKNIIAACDTYELLNNVLPATKHSFLRKECLKPFLPSTSGFLLYLGLKNSCNLSSKLKANLYVINSYGFNDVYKNYLKNSNIHYVLTSPSIKDNDKGSKQSLCINTNALYHKVKFWTTHNKTSIAKILIQQAELIIPELSNSIEFTGYSSPETLYQWTYNHTGAAFGWASTINQFADPNISQLYKFSNFYQVGHWSNLSSGIPMVALSGANTAQILIYKHNKNAN